MPNIELEEALKIVLNSVSPNKETELIEISKARGRICSENIFAPINNPPFNRSPLDGYALNSSDTHLATSKKPVTLCVIGEVCAGATFNKKLQCGEAIRIMTGAKIPDGCDCVIAQENTNYGENVVQIYKSLKPYENFCFLGEDIKKDTTIIRKGEKLSYIHLGVLASMGIQRISVIEKVRVGLLITGDELTPLGNNLEEGKIYNSNLYLLQSRLEELSVEVTVMSPLKDHIVDVANAITMHIDDLDLLITTGGVSVGKKDIFHDVLPLLCAKQYFWRVNIKPGTPVIYWEYRKKPIISLSGNPFAALTTFELIARPLVSKLCYDPSLDLMHKKAIFKGSFTKKSATRRFLRGIFSEGEVSLPEGLLSSGALYSMTYCNCLIDIEKGSQGLLDGQNIKIILI
ncbi:molybdopterin molybdotransferase MoeA [Clostridium lacusfryxellense]|uniref:molybdopterin molybdotransferase MoeA n=1 Tax=Clostridium lacusfryxellense TaxID=205328 RepID=UPI001C0DD0B7|nr:molybdopterin molybdotransferase MoeA [Clostridium lacusfryxellense]MBU3112623.1 molybdopterin molybdotransferase MoeA [Clostridium lacusfryxellense]